MNLYKGRGETWTYSPDSSDWWQLDWIDCTWH